MIKILFFCLNFIVIFFKIVLYLINNFKKDEKKKITLNVAVLNFENNHHLTNYTCDILSWSFSQPSEGCCKRATWTFPTQNAPFGPPGSSTRSTLVSPALSKSSIHIISPHASKTSVMNPEERSQ